MINADCVELVGGSSGGNMGIVRTAFIGVLLTLPVAARAAYLVTYTYNAKGQLAAVVRTSATVPAVQVRYVHDRANNRKSVVVTASGSASPLL